MRRREGGGEAMVRGEEAVATADEMMGEAEGGRRRRRARRRSASGGRGRTPHPCQHRRCRCRHRRHPPSRRRTSREGCRRPSMPTSTPSPLPRPATKEDVVDAEDDGATVAEVIATPDTTGGDDAREAIVLALSSSTRRALIVLSLVMNTFFSSFNDVDLPHSMLVDCCIICCQECGPIATV